MSSTKGNQELLKPTHVLLPTEEGSYSLHPLCVVDPEDQSKQARP